MSRIENLNSIFFPIPSLWIDGKIVSAPEEAVEEYISQKTGWLKENSIYSHKIPSVSIYPGKKDGQDGYFVCREIMYR